MPEIQKIKRALVSVSDKRGVVELGRALEQLGIEIISTGGTLKTLRDAGVHVISVSTFTGSPEILGGRVKTLHPKVHAGILFRRDNPQDVEQMQQADYRSIGLVVVNLYPFRETIAKPDVRLDEAIENIDIGGPTMIRAAAKNHEFVTTVVSPDDYPELIAELEKNDRTTTIGFRSRLAAKAFIMTGEYDTAIAGYLAEQFVSGDEKFPVRLDIHLSKKDDLRYGENPHQEAALYTDINGKGPSLVNAQVLGGKELSFNNYGDLDACLEMALDFTEPFACVVKHANPCGAAVGQSIAEAYKRAYDSDPLSAYGSIIGLNRNVDMACAQILHETPFVECILAPSYDPEALEMLLKKKTRRILALPSIVDGRSKGAFSRKPILGGMLLQSADDAVVTVDKLQVVTKRQPTHEEIESLLFAWRVVKHTKSNAIVIAKGHATVGIGMGQTSRVDSSFLAVKRAGERAQGAVLASDAFFPMPDGLEVATSAGVTAVIQAGGSKGDPEVIAAADAANVAMVFTGIRHFKH